MKKLIKQKETLSSSEIFNSYTLQINKMHTSFKQELNQVNSKKSSDEKLKEFKNLDLIRRKFLNDLFKQLSFIGLSYRKGNIKHNERFELDDFLRFSPIDLSKNLSWESYENEYYLCVSRYLEFKSGLNNVPTNQKSLTAIYQEKINGFLAHFMHIVHDQKQNLHIFGNKMRKFNKLNNLIAYLSKAVSGNQTNESIYKNFKEFALEIKNTISQFDFLIKSFLDPSQSISGINNSLQSESELLKAKIIPLKNDIELIWSYILKLSTEMNDDLSNIKSQFFSQELENFFLKI
jgi:hypothetical protein